ncbi:hypothetical protein DFP72DRAFT_893558 [Ephemerocybe angulata]|uniref:F-box domain-containing protein n=1 Tax=Ephemerocybe angulata TaxID=980116 RepID=A0A8H6I3I4_9AGAR|nr:hypothetical protein DFP72DRAFT_893558 [Tulosesus angulatus]
MSIVNARSATSTSCKSLMDWVPDDVWLSIFEICTRLDPRRSNRPLAGPYTLNNVCRDWRRICLANPVLWDTVCCTFGSRFLGEDIGEEAPYWEAKMEAVRLWMSRAACRPLSITFAIVVDPLLEDPNLARAALAVPELVVANAERIRHLDTTLSSEWLYLFNDVPFPVLETLKIFVPEAEPEHMGGHWDRNYWIDGTAKFKNCPKLTEVQLNGCFDDDDLPWSQLLDVTVTGVIPRDCAKLLKILGNVRQFSCELDGTYFEEDSQFLDEDGFWALEQSGNRDRMAGPVLDRLRLTTNDAIAPVATQDILGAIPLGLKHLELVCKSPEEGKIPRYDFILQTIPSFSSSLHTLILKGVISEPAPLQILLPQLTSLSTLHIETYRNAPPWSIIILSFLGAPDILPSLKNLHLSAYTKLLVEDDILLALLQHRRGCCRLETASFMSGPPEFPFGAGSRFQVTLAPTTVLELKEMKKEGLDLEVGYRTFTGWYSAISRRQIDIKQ